MKKIYLIALSLFSFILLSAQNDSIGVQNNQEEKSDLKAALITDRPDATESSFIVPARSLQIETGVIFENTKTNSYSIDDWYLGTTLLRYGVWDNFELRLGSYYQRTRGSFNETLTDTTENGLGPISAGFKVHVVEEKGWRPQIAVMADITLRHIGSVSYRPIFSYPTAKLLLSHTLTDKLSLGYNLGFAYNGYNADGFFVYSVTLAYSLFKNIGIYGEAFGNFDHGNLPNHRIDGGFTWLLKNNLQLDISAGTGFDHNVDKYFISSGFSWRIPK